MSEEANFPTGKCGFDDQDSLGYSLNFQAVAYENKQSLRNNAPSDVVADITLPLSKSVAANSNITYVSGETETTGGLFDPTSGGFWETLGTLGGFTTFFKDVTGISAFVGQRPMDERDSIFKGDWPEIAKICQIFQSHAYPSATDDQTYSRVTHPPVWWIKTFDHHAGTSTAFRWDMGPLPSVLRQVSVETATDGVFSTLDATGKGFPAATRLRLGFVELEPAVRKGKHIFSRSMIRGNINSIYGEV